MLTLFRRVTLFFVAALLLIGCKKEETVNVHENLYVSGNVAPPYDGVTTMQVRNYVNKMYIDLIGEEPSDTQLDADVAFLETHNLSDSARGVVINNVMTNPLYYDRLWVVTSTEMIEGMGPDELDAEILTYQYISDQLYMSGDTFTGQVIDYEVLKLQQLASAGNDLQAGSIDLNEFYARFIFNLIYDEINMGSENFVISCFENLYFRYPTVDELSSGVTMVDGFPAIVLLTDGNSKEDFIDILTNSSEFYEGVVYANYLALVLREPTSSEMTSGSIDLSNSGDLQALQLSIIKTDEYAGF